jgi:hypothetical protein
VPKHVCGHGLPRRWSPEVKDAAVVQGGARLGLGWRRIGFCGLRLSWTKIQVGFETLRRACGANGFHDRG